MDVLVSGDERPGRRLGSALGWQPPAGAVVALTIAVLATALTGLAGVGAVRAADERDADRVELVVEARSSVAVRPRGRDGVLVLQVRNDGSRGVEVRDVQIAVEGVRGRGPVEQPTIGRGATIELVVPFAVTDCRALRESGRLVLRVRPEGRAERDVALPVGAGAPVAAGLLAAGCRPAADPSAVAVGVRGLGGDVERTAAGARGVLLVEVRNEGAPLEFARVSAEVPGAAFEVVAVGPLPAGGRSVARLRFDVEACALLRRTGRVVVTVFPDGARPQELGFRATEDEEARTVRDVDLDLVLDACR
ncbi:MAG TPA: hypothetical protein VM433_01810 [Mycobacteriales bacterium]|nr:hypothetical protein [Mycobacteriales bacterium]